MGLANGVLPGGLQTPQAWVLPGEEGHFALALAASGWVPFSYPVPFIPVAG